MPLLLTPISSTYPRQRVADKHVYHAGAAEAGVHEDHPLRLLAHLADYRGLFAAFDPAQRLEGAVGGFGGDDGEQLALVGDVERVYSQDLARPVYDFPNRDVSLPQSDPVPGIAGELVQDRANTTTGGIPHEA